MKKEKVINEPEEVTTVEGAKVNCLSFHCQPPLPPPPSLHHHPPPPPLPLPSLPPPPLLTLPATRPPFLFDLVQSFLLIHSSYISFYLQIILYLLNCNCYSNCIFPRLKTLTWNLPSFNIYSSTGTSLSKWARWSDYRWNRSFPKNIWCHH